MVSGVQRVWGNESSHSQMNSHVGSWSPKWTPESSECNCRSQNPLDWKVFYIIEKLLKSRCLKWARIAHLDICNTSYGQKKGRESNWQFNSWPLKVRNWPNFVACKQRATYHWKGSDEGYNFSLDLISIKSLHTKLRAPKLRESPTLAILGLTFGSPGTKSHLDVAPMESYRIYYKGEGGGFPQVRAVVSLVCWSCPWLVLAPKVLQLCISHPVLVLCRFVWIIEACQFFLVPFRNSSMPLYPSKVLRARERAPTFYSSVVFNLGFTFESLKDLGTNHLMYPFARSFSSWTLSFFNSSWFIRYGALVRGATPSITSIAWSTRLLEGNSSGNSSGITYGNSSEARLMHFGKVIKLVASFGSNSSNTCITHNLP